MNTQETKIGGRPVRFQVVRVRHARKEWGYYNRVIGSFLDTNEPFSMGAAEFAKWSTRLEKESRK